MARDVQVRYTPRGRGDDTHFYVFDLEARQDTPEALPVTHFNQPLTLTLGYTQAEVEALAEDSLRLAYFDQALGEWITLGSRVDVHANQIVAQVNHLSTFGGEGDLNVVVSNTLFDFQTSLLTGDAAYEYPVDYRPGPAGWCRSSG